MRTASAVVFALLVSSLCIAQDKPGQLEKRVAELEREVEQLKKEIAQLRKELEATRGTGPVLWQFDMTSDLKGSGAIADVDGDGKLEILFGSYFNDAHLYCVEAATGAIKWKHKSHGGPLDASVAIADIDGDGRQDILCADSAYGKLYILDGKGGLQGTIDLPSGTDSPPAIADLDGDGTREIVVGTMWKGRERKGWVCCYNGKTREARWRRELPGCIQSEPCLVDLDGDKVLDAIVTSWRGDRCVTALNGRNGDVLWSFETPGNERTMGMYHGVALGGGPKPRIYVATTEGDVYCLNRAGKRIWHRHFDDYLFSPITVTDTNVDGNEDIVFGGRATLYVLSTSGEVIWTRPLASPMDRGVAIADADGDGDADVLYHDKTALVARDARTGEETFRLDAGFGKGRWEDVSSAPLITDLDGDGLLDAFVVCGQGTSENGGKENYGRALAVRLKGKGPGWLTFRSNLRRTGNTSHCAE
jgi:outer membrane protein assembly factor BamB